MRRRTHSIALPRARSRIATVAAACLLVGMAAASMPSSAATSSVTVNLSVLSATSIVATGCATGTSGVTEFGTVPAGTNAVTSADCVIDFGSTNDTSQLRLQQSDGDDRAMYQPTVGTADPTWDTDGFNFVGGHHAFDIDAYGDGDFITTGEANVSGWNFDVARWNDDGSLQWRFTHIQTGCGDCMPFAVDTMADGDILLAGHYWGANADAALMRVQPSGALDLTFDTDGYSRLVRAGNQQLYDVIEQPGKGIVAVGYSSEGGNDAAFVVRYTHLGALDTTFGTGGITILQHTGGGDRADQVALQEDGSLIVAGLADTDMFLTRLDAEGDLDTSFGVGGTRIVNSNGNNNSNSAKRLGMDIDENTGDILVASETDVAGSSVIGVYRTDADGTPIATFGTAGLLKEDIDAADFEDVSGLFIEPDGRIVVAFLRVADPDSGWLLRLLPSGARDTTFGANGLFEAANAMTDDQYQLSVASDSDGRITFVADNTTGRLATVTIPDHAAGGQDWDQGTGMFGACLRSLTGGPPDGTTWTVDADAACTAVDTDPWNPITAAGTKVARQASSGTATARLRFGVRAPAGTPKGGFVAPLRFTVLAPDV